MRRHLIAALAVVALWLGVTSIQRVTAEQLRTEVATLCAQIPGYLTAYDYTLTTWPVERTATAVHVDVSDNLTYFAYLVGNDKRWCDLNGQSLHTDPSRNTLLWHFGNASDYLRQYQAAVQGLPPTSGGAPAPAPTATPTPVPTPSRPAPPTPPNTMLSAIAEHPFRTATGHQVNFLVKHNGPVGYTDTYDSKNWAAESLSVWIRLKDDASGDEQRLQVTYQAGALKAGAEWKGGGNVPLGNVTLWSAYAQWKWRYLPTGALSDWQTRSALP